MAGDGEADVDLDSIVAAFRQSSPGQQGGRSPVYNLTWDHHARLAPELSRPRRPNWAPLAQALGDQGVLDGAGQALAAASTETVRKTWWKVGRDGPPSPIMLGVGELREPSGTGVESMQTFPAQSCQGIE